MIVVYFANIGLAKTRIILETENEIPFDELGDNDDAEHGDGRRNARADREDTNEIFYWLKRYRGL